MKIRKLICMWAVLLASPVWATPPSKVALEGGRIITVSDEDIAEGTVLIENGKITAVGQTVDIPYDAVVIDVSGKVIFPGMINAHASRGMDISNENAPVTPFLNVYDSIDPSQLYFEDALRDGVTSIHVIHGNNTVIGGLSRVVHPIGLTPDEMTQKADAALKISIAPKRGSDRMIQMATLRETFLELADYLDDLAESTYEKSLKDKDEKIDVGPDEARKRGRELVTFSDYDDKHANLVKLTRGKLPAFVYCAMASDVERAITVARDNGYFERMVFVLGTHCYKAIDALVEADRPVIIGPTLIHRERDPLTGELEETFVPKVLADARLTFAILPSPDASMAERYLNYQAARCVRNGVSRKKALKAITQNAARALEMGDRVGSIAAGKQANLVVLSSDPLDFNAWVEQVYINGIKAYDRAEDPRLERLFSSAPEANDPQGAAADTDDNDKGAEVQPPPAPADEVPNDDNQRTEHNGQ